MKPSVTVNLPQGRSYPIFIGSGLLDDAQFWQAVVANRQAVIITNTTVAPLYADRLRSKLSRAPLLLSIPDGEQYKTLATYQSLLDDLLDQDLDRSSVLIALGGGVVGDLAGFVAATYYRGVDYIQVPTTLLAQVDSAVGGKTAVNHPKGKNLIGSFYQPSHVVIDVATLQSLPQKIFIEGLAEVIKYGIIFDASFFEWLESNAELILKRDFRALQYIIQRSCKIKAEVVQDDETEQGRRAILNFGHTFGHALETQTGYGTLLHGEAVSIGMKLAAELSYRLGFIDLDVVDRVKRILNLFHLPITCENLEPNQVRVAMSKDKKVIDSKLRFILLHGIGQVQVETEVSEKLLMDTLQGIGDP